MKVAELYYMRRPHSEGRSLLVSSKRQTAFTSTKLMKTVLFQTTHSRAHTHTYTRARVFSLLVLNRF